MKKWLILMLSLVLILSFTACGGDKEEPVPQEEPTAEEPAEELEGFAATKTGKFYSQFADGGMYIKYETEIEGQVMTMISATQGDKIYSESIMDGMSVGISVIDGSDMYTIDHNSKSVIKIALGADAETMALEIMEEEDVNMDEYITGTRTIDGKEYDTEEWTVDGATSIMCFDGDQLAYIIGVLEGDEIVMKVIEVSNKVDADLFVIPADYTMMEM